MDRGGKLFPMLDVVSVNTGILIGSTQYSAVADIICHVAGLRCLPSPGTPERTQAVNAVRAQLPNDLAGFGCRDLAELTIVLKQRFVAIDRLRAALCQTLEKRFGKSVVLVPEAEYCAANSSLAVLVAIVEDPIGWRMSGAASAT